MKKWYHDRLPEIAEKPVAQNEWTFADAKNERWRKLGHGYSACPLPCRGTIKRVPQVSECGMGSGSSEIQICGCPYRGGCFNCISVSLEPSSIATWILASRSLPMP